MRYLFIFLLLLILAMLESTLVPLRLTLLAIICWSALRPAEEGLSAAFLAGLILDLFQGRPLGFSSLMFLLFSLLIYSYKNRFQAHQLTFLWPFSFLAIVLTNFLTGSPLSLLSLGLNSFLIFLFLPFLNKERSGLSMGEL